MGEDEPRGISPFRGPEDVARTAEASGGGWYRWYVVSILALAGALSYLDRQIMGIMVEPVKHDLRLTDLEISLLQGFAFVLFYSLMAVPLGYASDRSSRRNLIGIGILLWSFATAACGLAKTFGHLFLARMSVGIGEATLLPAAHSMLPDYFDDSRLPKAFAIFQMGQYIGGGSAYAIGGLIFALTTTIGSLHLPVVGELAPWQLTFIVAAAPGPLVALLLLTVREPVRRPNLKVGGPTLQKSDFRAHWRHSKGFIVCHLGTAAVMGMIAHGIVSWAPSFFIRGFGWTPSDVGMVYGVILITAGGTGTLFAARLARVWQRRGNPAPAAQVVLFGTVLAVPAAVIFPLCDTPQVALFWLFVFSFCMGITSTLLPTVLQLATPNAFRGRMGGLYVIATTAVGAALGPVVIAAVTDLVIGDPRRLNESIAIVCGTLGPVGIALSFLAYRHFARLTGETLEHSAAAPA